MIFEWDERKNKINIQKHGIKFETAITVFDDDDLIEVFDNIHSLYEERFVVIGKCNNKLLLLNVVYTLRDERYRIISARKANKEEREMYYDCTQRIRSWKEIN